MRKTLPPALLLLFIAASPAAAQSVQQQFDTASKAVADRRCAEAIALFEALEAKPAARNNALVAAAIDVRKGMCLAQANRDEEATAHLARGIGRIEAAGPDFRIDSFEGRLQLGALAEQSLELASAATHYRAAATHAAGDAALRLRALLGLVRTTSFDRDPQALQSADEALALVPAVYKGVKPAREARGGIMALKARMLMMLGRDQEAYELLEAAVGELGGSETLLVNANDIAARSDFAMAALRTNRRDKARTLLMYTGAGRDSGSLPRSYNMSVPSCGGALKPQDSAIVEFSVNEQGEVVSSRPVLAFGGREAAEAFAREVRDWKWDADAVKEMPSLFRLLSRVELHCTNAPVSNRLNLLGVLLEGIGRQVADDGRIQFTDDGKTGNSAPIAEVSGHYATAIDSSRPERERRAAYDAAIAAAQRHGLPERFLTYLKVGRARLTVGGTPNGFERRRAAALLPLLYDRTLMADRVSRTVVQLAIANGLTSKQDEPANIRRLDAVLADPGFAANDPLRQYAAIERANIAARQGKADEAATFFAQTNLDPRQCALLAPQPAMQSVGSLVYPPEVMQMGIEGWTRIEFDIDADGKPAKPRPVIAYPPFLFTRSASQIIAGSRFAPGFRSDVGPACSAATSQLRFDMP